MTGGEYMAYLETLMPGEASRFQVQAAASLFTEEERAANDERAKPRQRFAPMSAAEFIDRPPMKWVVQGVLPQADLALVIGEPGAGKSVFTYSLVSAISQGTEWFGHKTRQGRAVYLVAEGAGDFANRVRAYADAFDVDPDDLPEIIGDVPDLMQPKEAAALALAIGKADVLVIDTLSRVHNGNENSGEHMGPVVNHCKFLHDQTGATVILIHHPPKSGEGSRGWSGITGAADTIVSIEKVGDCRSAAIRKQKGGVEGPLFNFKVIGHEIGRDEWDKPVTGAIIEVSEKSYQPTAQKTKGGTYVDAVRKYVRVSGKTEFETAALVADVADTLPKTQGRDRRPEYVGRAVNALTGDLFEVVPGSDGESLKVLGIIRDNGGWLE